MYHSPRFRENRPYLTVRQKRPTFSSQVTNTGSVASPLFVPAAQDEGRDASAAAANQQGSGGPVVSGIPVVGER